MSYFVVLYIYISLYLEIKESFGISCKNEQNQDVDWFILYKFPKTFQKSSRSNLPEGSIYAYLTSSDSNAWNLSSISIKDENSLLGNTWRDLKRNEKEATYLFYNDEPPKGFSGSAVGHLKGFIGFDQNSGFWLMHSIPKFGVISDYEYPDSGLRYGQYAFCVTFDASQLDNISNHLLFCNPNIYLHKISRSVIQKLSENSQTLFSDKPVFIHKPPFLKTSTLQSLGYLKIKSFAKDNQLVQDLYSDIIAPKLKTSLISETWRNGAGHILPSSCKKDYSVLDATSIEFSVVDEMGESEDFIFSSTEDHSKWAVSAEAEGSWICFADLNRIKSQEKRGGGALCFQSRSMWKLLHKIISGSDLCPAT